MRAFGFRCNRPSPTSHHRFMGSLRTSAALVGLVVLAGCSRSSGSPGTVTGALPLCYGPGANSNLWPSATIETHHAGKLVRTDTFASSNEHRTYALTLVPGSYVLTIPARHYTLTVTVHAKKQVQADWPQPGCL